MILELKRRVNTTCTRTIALGLALIGVVSVSWLLSSHAFVARAQSSEPGAAAPLSRLRELGFSPASLAGAGGTVGVSQSAVSYLNGVDAELDVVAALKANHSTATIAYDQARMALRASGASSESVTAFEQAQSTLAITQSALAAAESDLRADVLEAITSQIGAAGVVICQRMIANRHRRVPEHFKALALTESQWKTLEIACLKAADEQPLRDEEAGLLSQCQNDPTAILVASRIQNNAPLIEAYFNQLD